MITLNVLTPRDRVLYTNGHRGRSFNTIPCTLNVFAGVVLLETINANGQVDFRELVTAVEGVSPMTVNLKPVAPVGAPLAAAPAVSAPRPAPKAPKTRPKRAQRKPGGGNK